MTKNNDDRSVLGDIQYDVTKAVAEKIADVPVFGEGYIAANKVICDNVIDPVVDATLGGTDPVCDAINEVHHGLNQPSNSNIERTK